MGIGIENIKERQPPLLSRHKPTLNLYIIDIQFAPPKLSLLTYLTWNWLLVASNIW
jgi:hypothetical protein